MTHTPGPWNFVAQIPENYSIEGPGGNGEVIAITALEDDKVDAANARLMASAPLLLEQLKNALADSVQTLSMSERANRAYFYKKAIEQAEGSLPA